jgi:hypothetical protein
MSTVARPWAGTASACGGSVRRTTSCDRPSPETTVTWTGMCAGAVIVGGFSEPPGTIVYVAGIRASSGGAPPVAGAPGFVVVSGAVGGVPVAVGEVVWLVGGEVVGGVVWVAGGGAVAVVFAVDSVLDRDVPHPTAVASSKTHKRTANLLTFAG